MVIFVIIKQVGKQLVRYYWNRLKLYISSKQKSNYSCMLCGLKQDSLNRYAYFALKCELDNCPAKVQIKDLFAGDKVER